jgi:predicted RNase H-like nuclease (RuvC/YqgF family)
MKPAMKLTSWIPTLLLVSVLAPVGIAVAAPQDSAPATGQQQEDPLAAAARKAREQRKNESKTSKVWDNENVPKTGMINVVGQASEPVQDSALPNQAAPSQSTQTQAGPPVSGTLSKEQLASLQANVESTKQQVESLKADIDIMQRKLVLDQQSYYGTPDYASDKAGAAALDDEKAQIESKQQELTDAQKHMEDLQAQIAAAASSAPSSQDAK